MNQNQIRRISEIISTPLKEFKTRFDQEYLIPLVSRYYDRVIAYALNPTGDYCNIILKGERKYFIIRFYMNLVSVDSSDLLFNIMPKIFRIREESTAEIMLGQMVVTNQKEFKKFKKILILNSLHDDYNET